MKAKKFLSILLAVRMLVAAFTACGGKEDKNSSSALTAQRAPRPRAQLLKPLTRARVPKRRRRSPS